jgi:transposase
MAWTADPSIALKPKPIGGRQRENMTLSEEKALLARFGKAAGAGEMLNIHDLKAAYEWAIGHATSNSTVYNLLARHGWRKLMPLPAYSPELNPQENLWDEIREKIFKNYALKSMEGVYAKLEEAAFYIERNPAIVKSITSFPYIVRSR